MNNQEAFDTATEFLLRQGCQSSYDEGDCYYRGPNGTKCAVGALIPDEIYDKDELEFRSINGIMSDTNPTLSVKAVQELFTGVDVCMLQRLQEVHDQLGGIVEDWPEDFRSVAKQFNLSTTHLEKVIAEVKND